MRVLNDCYDFTVRYFLFVLRPTTGQVRHKGFFKVAPDARPQPTRVRLNPKIPSAPSAFLQWGRLRRQEIKQQTIGKTILAIKLHGLAYFNIKQHGLAYLTLSHMD